MAKIRLPIIVPIIVIVPQTKILQAISTTGMSASPMIGPAKSPSGSADFAKPMAVPGFFGIDSAVRVGTILLQSDVISPRRNVSEIFTAM
jgi:hypothetical protein